VLNQRNLVLKIYDNGKVQTYSKSEGVGLRNIKARVEAVEGSLKIDRENGFNIIVTVPLS